MMAQEISFTLKHLLYADPDKVFEALTNPALIEKWGGGKAILDPVVGGNFEMFDGWVKGEVKKYKPADLLSYTWKPAEWKPKTQPTLVEIALNKHAVGTELLIKHTGFTDQQEANKHKEGWINFVLEPINDLFVA